MVFVILQIKGFLQSNESSAGSIKLIPLWTDKMHIIKNKLFRNKNIKYEVSAN